MNVYAWIILAALLVRFILSVVSETLNLRALRNDLPDEFEGVYDAEDYRKSQDYTRVRTRFGFVTLAFDTLALLIFWFAGGFPWLDTWVRGFGYGPIVTGIAFMGVLVVGGQILSLPFEIYSTFVIEGRFGFNRTTPKTFVIDLIKGLALGIAFGVPLLAAILWFFERTGDMAWIYCWIVLTAFQLFALYFFPTWIMPLFNRFEPLAEGELKDELLGYAKKVGFSLQGIFVMDGSRRSSRSNAFFTGFGKSKRIALFDTLVENHSVPELTAILAHEVGHYKKKHIFKGLIVGIVHFGVVFYLMSIFLRHEGLFTAFYVEQPSIYAGLIFFSMLYAPIELILGIALNLMSRRHEFEADHYAAETADGNAMVQALKKLSKDNLSNLTPHPFFVFLNYSHPPVLERIRALRG